MINLHLWLIFGGQNCFGDCEIVRQANIWVGIKQYWSVCWKLNNRRWVRSKFLDRSSGLFSSTKVVRLDFDHWSGVWSGCFKNLKNHLVDLLDKSGRVARIFQLVTLDVGCSFSIFDTPGIFLRVFLAHLRPDWLMVWGLKGLLMILVVFFLFSSLNYKLWRMFRRGSGS